MNFCILKIKVQRVHIFSYYFLFIKYSYKKLMILKLSK
jgi:hypothetical protein